MEYKASLDTLARFITTGVFALFVFIGIISVRALLNASGDSTIIFFHSGIILFLLVTVVLCYLFSTQKYSVNDQQLIIHRTIGDVRIQAMEMNEIHLLVPGDLTGTIRTFGVGGLFGYFGKYYNRKLGSMTWYTTQRINRIIIRTANGNKIVVSPDDISLLDRILTKFQTK